MIPGRAGRGTRNAQPGLMSRVRFRDGARKVAIGAVILAGVSGCVTTSTTPIKPLVLPELSESAARHPAGWHDTVSPDDKHLELTGRIQGVVVVQTRGAAVRDVFVAPFKAEHTSEGMLVEDAHTRRVYAREDVTVEVIHEDVWPKRVGGGVLLAVGIPSILLSAYLFVETASSTNSTLGTNLWYFTSGVTAAVGAALIIPGSLLIHGASKDPRQAAPPDVTLGLAPGQVRLHVTF